MVVANTQPAAVAVPGLPLVSMIDPRASHRLSSSNLGALPYIFGEAQNLRELRADPAFSGAIAAMHPEDAAVVEKPYFNQENSYFIGTMTPGGLVDALVDIHTAREHPLFSRSVDNHEEDVAMVREEFGELAKQTGFVNPDFAEHVRIVTLKPDDYRTYVGQLTLYSKPEPSMSVGGSSIAVAGLVVLPQTYRENFISSLIHEMHHQIELSVYVVPNDFEGEEVPAPANPDINSEAIEFHLLKSGVELALVDRRGNIYNAFTGFNEGLTQLFTNEMILKLAPKMGMDPEDLIYRGGHTSYPLHVKVVTEILSQIANAGMGKRAVYDRALRSYVGGTMEILKDLEQHFGGGTMRRIARVGVNTGRLRLLIATLPEFKHLRNDRRRYPLYRALVDEA